MKIVIVATYFKRLPQLLATVRSLNNYYRDDYEMVVVEDGGTLLERMDLNNNFPLEVISLKEKEWVNSGIPYNYGFEAALRRKADIIIIQNAECYHAGDIIGYAEHNLTDKNYISFPCYSLSKDDTLPPIEMYPRGASHDGDSAWYNHPRYRPVGYHFCAAITADNLRRINGFDERFKDGKDFEDNFLLHQVRQLGLTIEIPPEPYVFHQWHYSTPRPGKTNHDLYNELVKTEGYKATHLITPDL